MKNRYSSRCFIKTLALLLCALLLCGCAAQNYDESSSAVSDAKTGDPVVYEKQEAGLYTGIPDSLRGISITADSGSNIICRDPVFTIKTSGETSAAELAEYITMSPAAELVFESKSATEYTAMITGGLNPDTLYRINVGDSLLSGETFAFQTETAFTLKTLYPANTKTYVPTNSGIEMYFSDEVTADEVRKCFSIVPEVSGKFETYYNGRTVVFIPDSPLAELTQYTVSVAPGVISKNGDTLEAGKTSTFETTGNAPSYESDKIYLYQSDGTRSVITAGSGEAAMLSLSMFGDSVDTVDINGCISTEIYRIPTATAFSEMIVNAGDPELPNYKSTVYPDEGLEKIDFGTVSVTMASNEYGNSSAGSVLIEVSDLVKGIYLVNISAKSDIFSGGGSDFQFFVQFTDIGCAVICGSDIAVWSSVDGAPVGGASVDLTAYDKRNRCGNADGNVIKSTGKSNKDGITVFNGSGKNTALIITSVGTDTRVDVINTGSSPSETIRGGAIYTDRDKYFDDDKIEAWGVLYREGGLPSEVNVSFSETVKRVPVAADGTFRVSYSTEGYTNYGISISVSDDDGNIYCSRYVEVTAEEKPLYRGSVTLDKNLYMSGDTVKATVNAAFFDGTPAVGLSFRLYFGGSINDSVITGTDGIATVEFSVDEAYGYSGSTELRTVYISAHMGTDEKTSLDLYSPSSLYAPSAKSFTSIRDKDGIRISLMNYDFSWLDDITTPVAELIGDSRFIGDPSDGFADVTLVKTVIVKTLVSKYYDPVTKRTVSRYNYTNNETAVDKSRHEFKDGVFALEKIAPEDDMTYYVYNVEWNGYTLSVYANTGNYDSYDYPEQGNDIYSITSEGGNAYVSGDTVTLKLLKNKTEYSDGRTLFTVRYRDTTKYYLTDDGVCSFKATDDMMPYISACAVNLYDGDYHVFNGCALYYDCEKAGKLEVAVTSDSDEYVPGSEVKITVDVRDSDAKPVKSGKVLISTVDEACFALLDKGMEQYSFFARICGVPSLKCSTASDLDLFMPKRLEYYYNGGDIPRDGAQLPELSPEEDATKGIDSNSESTYLRETFLNNASFELVDVKDGKAEYTLKLPDNITEWRITALAYTEESGAGIYPYRIGTDVSDVISTLDFFINVQAADKYLISDDAAISARINGRSLDDGSNAELIASLYGENGDRIAEHSVSGKAGSYAYFNFGKLDEGKYTVTVRGEYDGHADAVKASFEIVRSKSAMLSVKDITSGGIGSIKPVRYPATLLFTDSRFDEYIDAVNTLYGGTERIEDVAAAIKAWELNERIYGESDYGKDEIACLAQHLNNGSGLFSILPYAEGDIITTAKICALVPDRINEYRKEQIVSLASQMISYGGFTETRELCAAYLTLAALGQPVLADLDRIYERSGEFDTEAKLYLAAAFAAAGDKAGADRITSALVGSLKESNGALYIAGKTAEDSAKLTALSLLSFAATDRAIAKKLYAYVSSHSPATDTVSVEKAFWLIRAVPIGSGELTAKYSYGGNEYSCSVSGGKCVAVSLDKESLSSFELISADKDIRVKARYYTDPAEAVSDLKEDDEITVTKSIRPLNDSEGVYVVRIGFSITTSKNYFRYSVADFLPSGAVYLEADNNGYFRDDIYAYAYESKNTRSVRGIICGGSKPNGVSGNDYKTYSGSLTYYISPFVHGEFTVEPAVFVNFADSTVTVTEQSTVNFK